MELSQQQKQNVINQYQELDLPDQKQSLCRFYLRGLCFFPKQICKYSHGIDDLNFVPYNNQPIVWKYQRTDYNQTKFIPKTIKYINLYDFQKDKKYTIQQIDENRPIRIALRQQMMKQQCQKFLEVLSNNHPDQIFSSDFVERQFTRVGFNKPTSTITFKKIVSYLSGPDSKYFVGKVNGKDALILKKTPEQIQQYFGDLLYQFVLKNKEEKIQQSDLKKEMFKVKNKQYPPLNTILKQKQQPFISYVNEMFSAHDQLRQFVCNNDVAIQSEANIQELTTTALQYLQKAPKIVLLDKFIEYVMQSHKTNNTNVVNPLKHIILQHGYFLYYLPMVAFIYNPKSEQSLKSSECPCKFKQQPDLSFFPISEHQYQLEQVEIIDDEQSFQRCLQTFITSKILAVDIQGRLRKGGHIEVIQFNNGKHVFLFDIFKITQLTFNFDLLESIKLAIRKVMLDSSILKIFHDSRHDGLALHEFMNTCLRNVFDTSGIQVLINEVELYKSQKAKDLSFVNQLCNIKTPGLNQLFKKYKAPHGINKSKQKFHHMMSISEDNIFHQRPFNQQYKEYCIKDVLDLIYLYEIMSKCVPCELIDYVGNHYITNSYQGTL